MIILVGFLYKYLFLFIWLLWVFSCAMWDLVPCAGIEPRPSALGVQSPSHWTTREVLLVGFLIFEIPAIHWYQEGDIGILVFLSESTHEDISLCYVYKRILQKNFTEH